MWSKERSGAEPAVPHQGMVSDANADLLEGRGARLCWTLTLLLLVVLPASVRAEIPGDVDAAVTYFEKAAFPENTDFWVRYMLAKAYLQAGRLGEAVAILETALARYDVSMAFNASLAVKGHYLLGLAYEKSGWTAKAIDQYQEFLEIWKDADPGIPEIEEARRSLTNLTD